MGSSLRNAGLLILAIIVLPVLIFSVFEIGNLRQNEKVIQNIYKNQLDAILFSINQYSDDIVSNLASRIENSQNKYEADTTFTLNKILNDIPSVKGLVQLNVKFEYFSSYPDSYKDSLQSGELYTELANNSKTIRQLQTYMHEGYRKIETIETHGRDIKWIVFLSRAKDQDIVNVLLIDPEKFISQVLDPKMQEIAKGKFDIAAYRPGEDLPFYTSNKQNNTRAIKNREPFWLFTNYLMGIELKDLTIADLTRARIKKNLIILGLMDIILMLGAWLIFRNVAKQVELSRLKSDFVSSVSHEIRTPLALITMYIETLEMGRVTDTNKIKEYYTIILNETTRLSGIVNRILNFSQIESNKRIYSFVKADLNEIVENAAHSFRYSIDLRGFSYSFVSAIDLPPVMADRDAVTDAFVNLVDNAMKYSTDTRNITVRTGKSDKHVYVEVEDHGIGISENNQKLIFDKFYRVTEMNLANKVKGSGLGLAIVKHIMDAHAGTIYVQSLPRSRFTLQAFIPGQVTLLTMKKILIVEDEINMVNGLRDNLEFEGFEVDTALEGTSGMKKILQCRYDLILLDIMLPEISGFEICKSARKEGVNTPIILLTARGEEIDKVLGLELGADDYITKPFSLRELLARIKAILRRSSTGKEEHAEPESVFIGNIKVNFRNYSALEGTSEIKMSHKEFEVLHYLYKNIGKIVSRDDLISNVWSIDFDISTRTVDNFILKLRQKIEADPNNPKIILTVHGMGYKMILC